MLSGQVHTLAFIQGHRLFSTCAAAPRPLGPGNRDGRGLANRQEKYFLYKRCRTGARSWASTLYLNYFESLELYIQRLGALCQRADKLSAHLTPIKLTATVYLSSLLSRRTIAWLQRPRSSLAGQFSCWERKQGASGLVQGGGEMFRCHRLHRHF